jgi:hypothetical protein
VDSRDQQIFQILQTREQLHAYPLGSDLKGNVLDKAWEGQIKYIKNVFKQDVKDLKDLIYKQAIENKKQVADEMKN